MPDAPLRWRYTAVSQFELPALPTGAAARGSWRRLWNSTRHLVGVAREKSLPEQVVTDRHDDRWLASVTPKTDPAAAAADLGDHLNRSEGHRDWLTGRLSKSSLRAVIAAPGFQLDEVLRELAAQHALAVLEPPARESFWDQRSWEPVDFGLDHGDPKRTLVLPNLQRWFLRHEDGLVLVRQLSLTDLVTVLRFSLAELQRRVHGLRRRGVLQQTDDVFQIRLSVYPDVRARLASEGFLVDAL